MKGRYVLRRNLCIALLLNFVQHIQTHGSSVGSKAFVSFAYIGNLSLSNDEPVHVEVRQDGCIFVGGNTSPFQRGSESDLGLPFAQGLRREDAFIAKVLGRTKSTEWVYRIGTSHEDRLQTMLLSEDGKYLYAAGRTFGQFPGTSYKGQADIFIVKYDISGSRLYEVWPRPLILGSIASEAVTHMKIDPANDSIIHATGFTTGNLFQGRPQGGDGLSDAILFSFSAVDGSVLWGAQFGTEYADHGIGIVIEDGEDSPIFVGGTTERRVGQFSFGNFHLYKFSRSGINLGSLLLRSYSREQLVGFQRHPMLRSSLLAVGSSWLDIRNGYDVFVKKIIRGFDQSDIGFSEMDIDDVGPGEYTVRLQSADKSHDYASGLLVDDQSGRLIISGYTAGSFAENTVNNGILAPFIASVDPLNVSAYDAEQLELIGVDGWVEIAAIGMNADRDGVYYVAKEKNETTNQFHTVVGSFGFPVSWRTPITIPTSPSPSASAPPTPTESASNALTFSPLVIAGIASGGVACAVIALIILISCRRCGKGGGRAKRRRVAQHARFEAS
ncbi:hypothetical protein FGB62_228g027 [Gracilaria domingensis]|nr:hypothetical protein FGB62_228g027 [Gracilaria domingensis]